jgi:hypothetical protein
MHPRISYFGRTSSIAGGKQSRRNEWKVCCGKAVASQRVEGMLRASPTEEEVDAGAHPSSLTE